MALRYKLSKETFKNKKIPPKIKMGEEHISKDQRGNDSSVKSEKVSSPLSLDKETITELYAGWILTISSFEFFNKYFVKEKTCWCWSSEVESPNFTKIVRSDAGIILGKEIRIIH